ncbi:MAG: hypothetical protein AB7Y46_07630 [Armatimonadota bacterium]
MQIAGTAREEGGADLCDAPRPEPLWLRAWLCSGVGGAVGGGLFLVGTCLLWCARGWQPGEGGSEPEIGLFLRMILGGMLGASLGSLLGTRERRELGLTMAVGGALSYVLALQVVIILYAACSTVCRIQVGDWQARLGLVLVAGSAGALAPPLIARLILRRREGGPSGRG